MNKKFSTLAASLLLATAFGSNAFAEKLVTVNPLSGKAYKVVTTQKYSSEFRALGISNGKVVPTLVAGAADWKFEPGTTGAGYWKISNGEKYLAKDATGVVKLDDTATEAWYDPNTTTGPWVSLMSFASEAFLFDLTNTTINLVTEPAQGTKVATQAYAYEESDDKVAADGGKLLVAAPIVGQNVYIVLDGQYLYVDANNDVVLVDKDEIDWEDYADIQKATWNVTESAGGNRFQSVFNNKYLVANASGFELNAANGNFFTFDGAAYQGLKNAALGYFTSGDTNTKYFLGSKWENITNIDATHATPTTTDDLFITDAPEALLYQAPEVHKAQTVSATEADFLEGHNVTDGMIVALSADGVNFITMKEDGSLDKKRYTSTVSDENALWILNMDNTNPKKIVYSFTNLKYDDQHLKVDTETTFHSVDLPGYTLGIQLQGTTTAKQVKVNAGTPTLSTTDVTTIGFYRAGRTAYTEGELNAQLGNGFDMSVFVSKKDKKSEINGTKNFTGVIEVKGNDGTTNTEKEYELFINGKQVVLSKTAAWSSSNTELMGKASKHYRGLKFDLIDPDDNNTTKYYSNFTIYKPISGDEDQIAVHVNGLNADLYVVEVDGTYYLTVSTDIDESDGETWPYVVFGSNGRVGDEILGKYYNIEYYSANTDSYSKRMNGQVLGIKQYDNDGSWYYSPGFYAVERIQTNRPEGQWAVRRTDATEEGAYTFVNREQGHAYSDVVLYKTAKENVYAVVSGYMAGADTIRVTPVETKRFEGYLDVAAADLRDKAYTMSIANILTEAYMYEKHSDKHAIALSGEAEEASSWRFFDVDTAYIEVEVGYINAKKEYKTKIDSLGVPVYSIANLDNEEQLGIYYNPSSNFLATSGEVPAGKWWADVKKFAFKQVGENYNMLPAEERENNYGFNLKMYGALSSDQVRTEAMYKESDNDIVILRDGDAAEYKTVAMGDTVTIFRDENPAQILTESGSYLSILNDYQFEVNPAMFVDTAYVDRVENGVKNNRPQYMLVVNPERRKLDHVCNVPGHPEAHTDTLYGRFLVNLMDSAILHKEISTHKTDFLKKDNSGSTYFAKLAFVPGFHTGDSLYLMVNDKKVDTLNLATPDFNVAKFSFRYEDVEDGSFKIQTAFKPYANADKEVSDAQQNDNGYLKWINDVLVVANNKNVGDVFNMETTEEAPTANESVEAAEVSVVAVKGAIIVKGAAGKVVTVANILGQTIANQVAASDNVTIAAPAGIAVVTVDGEATKVVVK